MLYTASACRHPVLLVLVCWRQINDQPVRGGVLVRMVYVLYVGTSYQVRPVP